jgi:hypothetical protein
LQPLQERYSRYSRELKAAYDVVAALLLELRLLQQWQRRVSWLSQSH